MGVCDVSQYSDHDPDAQIDRLLKSGSHLKAFRQATWLAAQGHHGAQLQLG
jgi:hypothetical protein